LNGATEPHRGYETGSGLKADKKLADAAVPPFLPDAPAVRSDQLDYCVEIEWFDRHLGQMLKALEDAGELDNTLVIVTADNGMPVPRAKANCYEYGIHVPLAVRWPAAGSKTGRRVTDPVGFVDLTATILDAAGAKPAGPAGDPRVYDANGTLGPEHSGYADIDAGPTLKYLTSHHADPSVARFLALAVAKRPAEELFDVVGDPGCLTNLAGDPKHATVRTKLADRLDRYLRETGDPRATGNGDVWETYKRYSPIRKFPPPGGAIP